MKAIVHNACVSLSNFIRPRTVWIYPLLAMAIFLYCYYFEHLDVHWYISSKDVLALASITGAFAGFMLTGVGLLLTLPENKFTKYIHESGHLVNAIKVLFVGFIFSILSTILGVFHIWPIFQLVLFVASCTEMFLGAKNVFLIALYANKSS